MLQTADAGHWEFEAERLCTPSCANACGGAAPCSDSLGTGGSAPPSVTQGLDSMSARLMRFAFDATKMRASRSLASGLAPDGNVYCNCAGTRSKRCQLRPQVVCADAQTQQMQMQEVEAQCLLSRLLELVFH